MAASCGGEASTVTATTSGVRSPARRRSDQPGEVGGLVEAELTRRPGDDVEPDGVGARGDRGQRTVGVGDAADLDERSASDGWRDRQARDRPPRRPRRGRRRLVGPDERLADQRAIEAERPPAGDRRRLPDAGFGHDQAIVGNELAQPRRPLDVHLEGPQVAVVEADEACTARQRTLELSRVVHLDERLHPELERPLDETRQPAGGVQDGEQQDEVSARRPEQRQLDLLDHELLGQDREGDGRPDRAQVVERAAEPVRLAQDRDRGGATRLVGSGASDEVVAGRSDPPGRRRRPLELGDQVETGGRQALGDRARTRCRPGRGEDLRTARAGHLGHDVRSTPGRDLLDHVAPRACSAVPDVLVRPLRHDASCRRPGGRRLGRAPLRPKRSEQLGTETGVDGQGGALDPLLQLVDDAGDEQGCAGVEQHDVTARARARRAGSPRSSGHSHRACRRTAAPWRPA